jgi:hypothetical protein
MPPLQPVERAETFISNLTNSYQTLIPILSTTTSAYAMGYRMRKFMGGHVYNLDNTAHTVILSYWDGTTDNEYQRILLDAQYFRYIFDEEDFRSLGTSYGIRIKTSDAADPTLVALGRYTDS